MRAYVYARQRGLLWGSLASCGRLSIGQMPRWHRTAAVANRRAGCQPAPHRASVSTFMSCTRRRSVRQSKASGQSATLLQDPGAAGAAERCEIESRLDDGRAHHFDAFEIARSEAGIFGEAQGAVAGLKGRRAAVGHGVETHHAHANRVGIDAVEAGDDDTGAHEGGILDPRTLAAGHGADGF